MSDGNKRRTMTVVVIKKIDGREVCRKQLGSLSVSVIVLCNSVNLYLHLWHVMWTQCGASPSHPLHSFWDKIMQS